MTSTAIASSRRFAIVMVTLVVVAVHVATGTGCTPSTPPSNLVPVDGIIHVDGKPVAGITLTLHTVGSGASVSAGISEDNGIFRIDTHSAGDGALPGEYIVTFRWSEFDPLTREQVGDKLGDRYSNASTSTTRWTLTPGQRFNAGTINLTSPSP